MKFTILTLFPELVEAWSRTGLIGSAVEKKLLEIQILNPRDFATDKHKSVDDTAFGGSDGMVMKFEPLALAIESAGPGHVAFLSPQGALWNQAKAWSWQKEKKHIVLVCGRYAGFDHRLVETYADEEVSIGDYILNGGELAALAVAETVARLISGVLGNDRSICRESFTDGLLEAPVFTRPREVGGMSVPSALLSGHHAEIARFERDTSLVRTRLIRPEWIKKPELKTELYAAVQRLKQLPASELAALGLSLETLRDLERENV